MLGTLGACPIETIVELTKFQLSKCKARIHTGFCVGGGEREICGGGKWRRT